MKAEQVAQRLFNTIRNQVARNDITMQLSIYQELVDELEREMGRLEDEGSSEDEMFDTSNDDELDDEV
jgi:prefoldin subunit 5